MNKYLLEVEENAGEPTFVTRHLIEATDEQMVKYHFHRTLKDWGYTDTQFGKHTLENWDQGIMAEIVGIRELEPEEHSVLSKFLYEWSKV